MLKDFFTIFPDEESCISYVKEIRRKVSVTHHECGRSEYTWSNGRGRFQCKKRGRRISK